MAIADAYLGAPADFDQQGWEEATAALGPDGAAETALWLTKWSRNKVRVSLGLDPATVERRLY